MTRRTPRGHTSFFVVVCALTVSACGRRNEPAARPPAESPAPLVATTARPLLDVQLPDMSAAGRRAQQQLRDKYASLTAVMRDPRATDHDLGTAYAEVGKLLMAADYREAAEPCLVNASVLIPQDIRWPYYLGHLYKLNGNSIKSLAAFERARRLDPADVPTLVSLGSAYLDQARTDEAEQLFREALSHQRSAAAWFGLGRAALAKRDYAAAAEQLQAAQALDPAAAVIHYPLAMAYRGLGDVTKAEQQLRQQGPRQIHLRDPLMEQLDTLVESAAAYELRGVRALDEGLWTQAADYFRKAIELAPDEPRLRHKLATALSMAGDTSAALRQFQEVARRWPTFSKGQYSLGVMLASAGRYRDAIDRFSTALTSEPTYVEARLQLAESLRATGAFEASLDHYRQATALDPRTAEARFGYAMALVGLNRYQEAHAVLTDAMATFPNQPGFSHAAARLLAAAPDEGIRDGRRALAIVQGLLASQAPSIVIAETTAMALAELQRYEEAAGWQRDAMKGARQTGRLEALPQMANRLALYEHGKPCRTPWGGEVARLTL